MMAIVTFLQMAGSRRWKTMMAGLGIMAGIVFFWRMGATSERQRQIKKQAEISKRQQQRAAEAPRGKQPVIDYLNKKGL